MAKGLRRITFVTGTRAEFGLMRTVLEAIRVRRGLKLQIVATGMHLDKRHGEALEAIRSGGFEADEVVDWPGDSGRSPAFNAAATGGAIAAMAEAFVRLRSDVVLVAGDRVEAFAAAVAGHLSHRVVAHVHGGDRALGQVDDSLRHAITKLAHVHFPATAQSSRRIEKLGEEKWRIDRVGSPGVDRIKELAVSWAEIIGRFAGLERRRYALVVLHPVEASAERERKRAEMVLAAVDGVGFEKVVLVYPNNDPGCVGIIRCWERAEDGAHVVCRDLPRGVFLGLMRDAAALVGNSSSGIIEAGSFGLPVVDIGPRQEGRERGGNVAHCEYEKADITRELKRVWNNGRPRRARGGNVYGGDGAGRRIADCLAGLGDLERLRRKLISY